MAKNKSGAGKSTASKAAGLRKLAEERALENTSTTQENIEALSPAEWVLHELQVHQIELEMQNEELRRFQAELEESHASYFNLYDLAPVGYLTINEKGMILNANLTSANLLGVDRNALLKQPFSRFIDREDHDACYLQRKQLLETREPQAYELRMLKEEGIKFWGRLESTVVNDAAGAPVCRTVISDITESKKKESEIQALMKNLVEKNADLEAFAYMISHDLKTPIITINGFAKALLEDSDGVLSEKCQKHLSRIINASQNMNELINAVLNYSRLGRIRDMRAETKFNTLVFDSLAAHEDKIRQRGIAVNLNENPVKLRGENMIIAQVFDNLIDNAIKYIGDDNETPTIEISADVRSGQAVFCVRDNGIGIHPEFHEKIFGVFQRLKDAKGKDGTGIGLAIVKRIVEAHDGSVWVESNPGEGSAFFFSMPTAEN